LGINSEIFQKIQKLEQMKKFLAIAIIAATFVACNNSGKGKGDKDTTVTDTTVVTPPVDTTGTPDTTANADTTAPKM
jgi:hypothetical protein